VSLSAGTVISWVDEMRYLGIFIVRSRTFKCSLKHAKRHFFRAANHHHHHYHHHTKFIVRLLQTGVKNIGAEQ